MANPLLGRAAGIVAVNRGRPPPTIRLRDIFAHPILVRVLFSPFLLLSDPFQNLVL